MGRTNDERFEDEPPTVPHGLPRPSAVVCPSLVGARAGSGVRAFYSTAPLPGPARPAPRPSPFATLLAPVPTAAPVPRKPTAPGLGQVADPFPDEEALTPTVGSPEADSGATDLSVASSSSG